MHHTRVMGIVFKILLHVTIHRWQKSSKTCELTLLDRPEGVDYNIYIAEKPVLQPHLSDAYWGSLVQWLDWLCCTRSLQRRAEGGGRNVRPAHGQLCCEGCAWTGQCLCPAIVGCKH